MKRLAIILCLLASTTGCMEHELRNKTMKLSATTADLVYIQVLDNIARTIDNPCEMPYFDGPAAGTAQIQRTLTVTATPQWQLLSTAGAFGYGTMLFNQISGVLAPSQSDQESWQMSPLTDPDRLYLMHCAYLRATCQLTVDPNSEAVLNEYFAARNNMVTANVGQVWLAGDVWRDAMEAAMKEREAKAKTEEAGAKVKRAEAEVKVEEARVAKMRSPGNRQGALDAAQGAAQRALDAAKGELNDAQVDRADAGGNEEKAIKKGKEARDSAKMTGGGGAGAAHGPLPIHIPYSEFVRSGWYHVGKKCDVCKDACYTGHHCETHVWVDSCHVCDLAMFTYAILDFYNINNTGAGAIPPPSPSTLQH